LSYRAGDAELSSKGFDFRYQDILSNGSVRVWSTNSAIGNTIVSTGDTAKVDTAMITADVSQRKKVTLQKIREAKKSKLRAQNELARAEVKI
jgi:hypothetical protein